MSEQLEVRISGRDFGISLKGYNEQASLEIRELFDRGDTDLLTLLRAYLDVVHKKCELEASIHELDSKIAKNVKIAKIDRDTQKHAQHAEPQRTNDLAQDDTPESTLESTFAQKAQEPEKAQTPQSSPQTPSAPNISSAPNLFDQLPDQLPATPLQAAQKAQQNALETDLSQDLPQNLSQNLPQHLPQNLPQESPQTPEKAPQDLEKDAIA